MTPIRLPGYLLALVGLIVCLGIRNGIAADGLHSVPLKEGIATFDVPDDGQAYFLSFGKHDYAPTSVTDVTGRTVAAKRSRRVPLALFQDLHATCWEFPAECRGRTVHLHRKPERDPFWDQLIVVGGDFLKDPPRWKLVETGDFGAVLSNSARSLSLDEVRKQQASLVDPVIPETLDSEMTWEGLAGAAYPLDFQKVLLATPHDTNPAFVYQNGQWFTTWPVSGNKTGLKEDRWFAPALAIGDKLVRPAPLSARTGFARSADGKLLSEWTLTWSYGETTVEQTMFAHQADGVKAPAVFVRFRVKDAPTGCRLALGTGRRLNAHYWDDKSRERSPVPFFARTSDCMVQGGSLVDDAGRVLLAANRLFDLEHCGPLEDVLLWNLDSDGVVEFCTPTGEAFPDSDDVQAPNFDDVEAAFHAFWIKHLHQSAQAKLPSREWADRIDAWRSQVTAITRVHYQGRERLSYGAYFYQYYFGIEEAWPVMALAQWHSPHEAQRQAEIMLEKENLDKTNIHHQSRNGAAPWAAAVVARLTDDPAWLARVAPTMIESARWTESVRHENQEGRSELTSGLLPPHIYGGDVRDPATSLYAAAICWKGMFETAETLKLLGDDEQIRIGEELTETAQRLRDKIFTVMRAVSVRSGEETFVPLALELPSLGGKHEGPYRALTSTRYGNYWNLFAPSLLQLQLNGSSTGGFPDADVLHYMANRGGLWGSLPRFYDGLDAAYAGGVIEHLLHASAIDAAYRPRALAALESYFLHAASRNGYTIPEVAALFPDRLNRDAYEQLVREAPWSFGMYDDQRYLEGHISFTEPLGAGAGQALSLIRSALVLETRDPDGALDGNMILLPTIPTAWLKQGQKIRLDEFATEYGLVSLRVESDIDKTGEIAVSYNLRRHSHVRGERLKAIRIRLAPPGLAVKEFALDLTRTDAARFKLE